MSATTLIIVGMIEVFLIAVLWIGTWANVCKEKASTKLFSDIVQTVATLDDESINDLRDAMDELRNVKP